MSLYAIADLHLALSVDKPMDIFCGWEDYHKKIEENWLKKIKEDDTVVIPGDISWAMNIEEAYKDFEFINRLPGKKIILKGNHDYWFSTKKKAEDFFESNGFQNIYILHNNSFFYEDYAICGTRGWINENKNGISDASEKKMLKREAIRLEISIKSAGDIEPIIFLHYPPFFMQNSCREILEIIHKYNVKRVFYGHVHDKACSFCFNGIKDGVEYRLISSDYIKFDPLKII